MANRKTYTDEFKRNTVARYLEESSAGTGSMAQIERELGLSKGSIARWRKTHALEDAINVVDETATAVKAEVEEATNIADEVIEIITEEPILESEKESTSSSQENSSSSNNQSKIDELVAELQRIADQIREQFPQFAPPPFSIDELVSSFRQNAEKIKPEVLKDLEERLSKASAEDLRDSELWQDLWHIISYAAQRETEGLGAKMSETAESIPGMKQGKEAFNSLPTIGEAREKFEEVTGLKQGREFVESLPGVKETQSFLSSLPGAKLISNVSNKIDENAPKDFLNRGTWNDIVTVIDHSLKSEISDLRKRMGQTPEDDD